MLNFYCKVQKACFRDTSDLFSRNQLSTVDIKPVLSATSRLMTTFMKKYLKYVLLLPCLEWR